MSDLPPGADLIEGLVSAERAAELISIIGNAVWKQDLRRRVQHYGWRYDYKARRVIKDDWLGPLPAWLAPEVEAVRVAGHFEDPPDQVIVNEYQPGQGIAPHIDCVPCFGSTIESLSLGSVVMMRFESAATGEKSEVLLPPRSLLVLTGPARYEWRHGISPRKSDILKGVRTPRKRRISLTFRTVVSGWA